MKGVWILGKGSTERLELIDIQFHTFLLFIAVPQAMYVSNKIKYPNFK